MIEIAAYFNWLKTITCDSAAFVVFFNSLMDLKTALIAHSPFAVKFANNFSPRRLTGN